MGTIEDEKGLAWFHVKFANGLEVEIHAVNAIEIYDQDYKPMILENALRPEAPVVKGVSNISAASSTELSAEIAKPTGTQDAILKILATPWGKMKLRVPKEVKNELEKNGYQFSDGAVNGALSILFQNNHVRRQKLGSAYSYGLPLK